MVQDGDENEPDNDPLREQLLEATARVFATKGYAGTKIMDIVQEAGLTSGAVYGRFESKDDMLMAAVLQQVAENSMARRYEGLTVAELLVQANGAEGDLDDVEAMWLEAFVAARRSPAVAKAIDSARELWHEAIREKWIKQAVDEGGAVPDADFESIIYFMESLQLGLLVQRGAGQFHPDAEAWEKFLTLVLRAAATSPKPD